MEGKFPTMEFLPLDEQVICPTRPRDHPALAGTPPGEGNFVAGNYIVSGVMGVPQDDSFSGGFQ